MRILLDECIPRKLKLKLAVDGHSCETARESGFGGLANGALLTKAEFLFDVLVTIDRNMRYQQNLRGRNIAIVVLCARSNDLSDIEPFIADVLAVLQSIQPGQILEVGLR